MNQQNGSGSKDGNITQNLQKNNESLKYNYNNFQSKHKDGIGLFGQYYKTEYTTDHQGDKNVKGGVIKKRHNYVLYVSTKDKESNFGSKNWKQQNASMGKNESEQKNKELNENKDEGIKNGEECVDDENENEEKITKTVKVYVPEDDN